MMSIKNVVIFPLHLFLQLFNLAIWGLLIIAFGVIKFLLPFQACHRVLLNVMHHLYFAFGILSVGLIRLFNTVDIRIEIDQALSKQKWYLITANHVSYLDIIVLIEFCAPRIPPPKFFLKKQLIWLPFVGLAAWALDMPFMRRYSQAFVERHPHLRGKDIETTKRYCQRYVDKPTTVINFVEGTRFTPEKHALKKSPFSHLMRPKAGGIAFTLSAMGDLFSDILDITIAYPNSKHPMMDMLSGRMTTIIIDVATLPVTTELIGDYFNSPEFQGRFQTWLNALWERKNARMRAWMN